MRRQLARVGVREFRESLAGYLESSGPVAITRHGRTVGYYIPASPRAEEEEILSLKQAVEQLEALLAEHGVSEEEVVAEFRKRRAQR